MNKFKYISFAVLTIIIFLSCSKKQMQSGTDVKKDNDSLKTFSLTEWQKNVLSGAKKCLEEKFDYDMGQAYHVLTYLNGENTHAPVFPNGDLEPTLGVCTDVTIRALRIGGVVDLQEAIYNDVKLNWNDYPMKRWNAKKPDKNIDHRRVPNQIVWFEKNWETITGDDYLPGDIIAWDMNEDSWGDHIGIVSDYFSEDRIYLIHNFPSPGYVAEEDVLDRWKIIGHYRIKG